MGATITTFLDGLDYSSPATRKNNNATIKTMIFNRKGIGEL